MTLTKRLEDTNQIVRLGIPLIIGHLAVLGMSVIDTLMAGQVSAIDLAGLAVGSNIWFILVMTLGGLLSACTPRIAHFYGAGRSEDIRLEMHQSAWLALGLGIAACLFLVSVVPYLYLLGAEPEVTAIASDYLQVIALSVPGVCMFNSLRSLCEGTGSTRVIMVITLLALPVNMLVDYLLLFGKFGFPELGSVGCAWATTVIYYLMLLLGLVYVASKPHMKQLRLFDRFSGPDIKRLRAILALGLPICLSFAAEEAFFNISALSVAPLGAVSLGAFQILIDVALMVLMVSLGLGQATCIKVAQSLGAGKPERARLMCRNSLLIVIGVTLVLGILMSVFRVSLMDLFSENESVALLGASLILFAPLYLTLDACQIYCITVLRGYGDVRKPLMLQLIAYWGLGFPIGYSLAHTDFWSVNLGVYGFWIGFLVAVLVGTGLFSWRLLRISYRHTVEESVMGAGLAIH